MIRTMLSELDTAFEMYTSIRRDLAAMDVEVEQGADGHHSIRIKS